MSRGEAFWWLSQTIQGRCSFLLPVSASFPSHPTQLHSVSMSQPAGASGAPAANIRVYVRVRPLNSREVDSGCTASGACLVADPHRRTIEFTSSAQKGENRTFTFDHVSNAAETHNSQEDVFQKVGKPITDSCLAGYNGTILAYGQTVRAKNTAACGQGARPARASEPITTLALARVAGASTGFG